MVIALPEDPVEHQFLKNLPSRSETSHKFFGILKKLKRSIKKIIVRPMIFQKISSDWTKTRLSTSKMVILVEKFTPDPGGGDPGGTGEPTVAAFGDKSDEVNSKVKIHQHQVAPSVAIFFSYW